MPKKSLGQNFLKNESIARDLVHAADVGPEDVVVEVGPGRGMITKVLLRHAKRVIAVEKDEHLAAELEQKFANEIANKKLTVIPADILSFDLKNLKSAAGNHTPNITHLKLVGSIPYYITGRFLRRFLSIEPQLKMIALIIQKEVASRICGSSRARSRNHNKESLLSISVKAYGTPRYVKTVKAGSFAPAPKVDSAIIVVEGISKDFFMPSTTADMRGLSADLRGKIIKENEEKFFTVVRAGFAHPRKKLASNLKNNPRVNPGVIPRVFENARISPDARAENLSVNDWKKVTQLIS